MNKGGKVPVPMEPTFPGLRHREGLGERSLWDPEERGSHHTKVRE